MQQEPLLVAIAHDSPAVWQSACSGGLCPACRSYGDSRKGRGRGGTITLHVASPALKGVEGSGDPQRSRLANALAEDVPGGEGGIAARTVVQACLPIAPSLIGLSLRHPRLVLVDMDVVRENAHAQFVVRRIGSEVARLQAHRQQDNGRNAVEVGEGRGRAQPFDQLGVLGAHRLDSFGLAGERDIALLQRFTQGRFEASELLGLACRLGLAQVGAGRSNTLVGAQEFLLARARHLLRCRQLATGGLGQRWRHGLARVLLGAQGLRHRCGDTLDFLCKEL